MIECAKEFPMTLSFPHRLAWFLIGILIVYLMQSGCQPIQPPTVVPPTATSEEASEFIANTTTETTSPDGNWSATIHFQVPQESDEYYQSLIVTHASGSPSYTLVDGWFPWGLGYKVAEPLTWSQDGERFYYTNRIQADGCGLLYNGSDLYQVDLATGETREILPPDTAIKLGLAPDEQHVAYIAMGKPNTLLIHNLASDEITPFDIAPILGDDQMGAIVWSPDSSNLVFAVAHNPCSGSWAESTSIYTLDIDDLTLIPRLEQDDRLFIPVAWPTEDTLTLENQEGGQFTLDLATNTGAP
jgi:hypothetical protein